jgi:acyl-CoA synthetase (AMP-forming)/AMP-acid ligase II
MAHVLEQANPKFIFAGGSCTLNTGGKPSHTPPNISDLYQAAEDVGMKDRVVALSDILNQHSIGTDDRYVLGNGGTVKSLEDTALLLFTSGTTGKPKAAVVTHRNIYHQVTDLIHAWEWQPSDVAIHVLPLHHVHGVVNLLSCAAYIGARLEFQPFHAENLWKQWASTSPTPLPKPNILMAVPTIYAKLLEAADKLPRETIETAVENTLHPMRLMVSGSAALPVSVLERWKKLTRGHTLLERYGMTGEFTVVLVLDCFRVNPH